MEELNRRLAVIKEWLGTGSINFFGRPFAGKDTQAERLASYLGVSVIGGGEILRGGNTPAHVLEAIGRGELAPTEDYKESIEPCLSKKEFQGKPLLLSSVGRMAGEEPVIIEETARAGHPTKAVVYIDITEEEVMRRRETSPDRSRDDDKESHLSTRLEWFNKYTLPVLDTYRDNGLLLRIDGMPPEEEVFEAIVEALYSRASE